MQNLLTASRGSAHDIVFLSGPVKMQ